MTGPPRLRCGVGAESVIRERSLPPRASLLAVFRRPAVVAALLLALVVVAAGLLALARGHGPRSLGANGRGARGATTVESTETMRKPFLLAREALALAPDNLLPATVVARRVGPRMGDHGACRCRGGLRPVPSAHPGLGSFFGRTPLERVTIPRGMIRVRISKTGFQLIDVAVVPGDRRRYRLYPESEIPPGMVRVTGGRDPNRFGKVGEVTISGCIDSR